jgi:hypothetical protein
VRLGRAKKKIDIEWFALLYFVPFLGAVAQLGERMTGSHEVRGSIPLSSTKLPKEVRPCANLFFYPFG